MQRTHPRRGPTRQGDQLRNKRIAFPGQFNQVLDLVWIRNPYMLRRLLCHHHLSSCVRLRPTAGYQVGRVTMNNRKPMLRMAESPLVQVVRKDTSRTKTIHLYLRKRGANVSHLPIYLQFQTGSRGHRPIIPVHTSSCISSLVCLYIPAVTENPHRQCSINSNEEYGQGAIPRNDAFARREWHHSLT